MQNNGLGGKLPEGVEMVEVDGKMLPVNSGNPGEWGYGLNMETGEYVRTRVPNTVHLANLNKYLEAG